MKLSKTRIDKSGLALAKQQYKDEIDFIELEECFDLYRQSHPSPLSKTTIDIQNILREYIGEYYIAQRLKRKPQIIRKLNRLSVRLTQLQDIGGCRIIVPTNRDVDKIYKFLSSKKDNLDFLIKKVTDYREKGRDDSGYRALHIIIERENLNFELQIRSRIQHYWAESIEKTSVVYGYYLKEQEGDRDVINYFKELSDVFYEIESGRKPTTIQKLNLEDLRKRCEVIIQKSDTHKILNSYVNEGIISALIEKEKRNTNSLNNWILIFDWNAGVFVSWDVVAQDPKQAVEVYVNYENQYPSLEGFEVVLIGSSDIASVQKTHSHYFGIASYENILETLDESIFCFAKKDDIDIGARRILAAMVRHKFWGTKTVTSETLKNHFCQNLFGFDYSLRDLIRKELIKYGRDKDLSLNIAKKMEIESYL
ncbi:TPA: RelA/SpoT domain-containing protein [Neisseria meningitidis]